MPKFSDIKQFTKNAVYSVDVSISYLPSWYRSQVIDSKLNVCPDFQRGYVWTLDQKIRYVEFLLRGGSTGRDIYCNCPGWKLGLANLNVKYSYVLVDGKQRLDAVIGFLNNEFPIFGNNFMKDYEDKPNRMTIGLKWHVNDLETYDEVLQWYIDLNSGGTVHSSEEIKRVKNLIGKSVYSYPDASEIIKYAGLERQLFK